MLTKLEMGLTIQLTIFRNGVKKNKINKEYMLFLFWMGTLISKKRQLRLAKKKITITN